MKMRRPIEPAAGFTLIEVMISMFFLAFIVGELAMVSTYARRSTAYAQRVTEANMFAEAVLEKARNAAWNNLDTRFSAADNPPDPIVFDLNRDGIVESYNETCASAGVVTTCTAAAGTYTIVRTVTPYLPSAATPFASSTAADIGVVVSWRDAKGATQEIRVATVRTKF
ncbi:MAG TPA: prepilin-type N-terminal cleavage/methylation domain-containing protein [Candidatus Methanoperedens sp.]|nr:prepilin-type N-terminal cleavage/methylation domain-containing protein [Candidatus Methanoperedens sp.]